MQNHSADNCSVRILSETDGKRSFYTAKGRLERTAAGVRLSYRTDGAFVAVEADGGGITMRREGEIYLRLRFCVASDTAGEIGLSPEAAGRVRIFSERAESFFTEENGKIQKLKILLEYVLSFSAGEEQRISLRLVAERKIS